jgi:hypothetical protein
LCRYVAEIVDQHPEQLASTLPASLVEGVAKTLEDAVTGKHSKREHVRNAWWGADKLKSRCPIA